ncbi:hypothetical protein DEI91_10900 [Curtobacterium sp. MCBD17_032]|nr:hypothetical protein DEI91_10900 [Curtobacterium sp. MCBD17_032]
METQLSGLERPVPLSEDMGEHHHAAASRQRIGVLRTGNHRAHRPTLRDVQGLLTGGSRSLPDRHLAHPDGSPDIEPSDLFRSLAITIRGQA